MRKGGKEEQSCRRKTSAKEKALGWEACTAVVACFICVIVQAGFYRAALCVIRCSPGDIRDELSS